jgi:hypothetical protein
MTNLADVGLVLLSWATGRHILKCEKPNNFSNVTSASAVSIRDG